MLCPKFISKGKRKVKVLKIKFQTVPTRTESCDPNQDIEFLLPEFSHLTNLG